jgi:2-keto-4-pentenoate hydratase
VSCSSIAARSSGAASLGHPAAAVAWLGQSLAADGEGRRAGAVGWLTAAVPVVAGDSVVVSIDRMGSVELACV